MTAVSSAVACTWRGEATLVTPLAARLGDWTETAVTAASATGCKATRARKVRVKGLSDEINFGQTERELNNQTSRPGQRRKSYVVPKRGRALCFEMSESSLQNTWDPVLTQALESL